MDPPQPVSTCVLYKYDLVVVCREQAVLCDDLTVIHILMWAALNERGSSGKAQRILRNALFTGSDRICMYFLHIIHMIKLINMTIMYLPYFIKVGPFS